MTAKSEITSTFNEQEDSNHEIHEDDSSSSGDESSLSSSASSSSSVDQYGLLSLACEHDRVDIIQTLLEKHPHLLHSYDNVPPLHLAIASGSARAATCLLRAGADPSRRCEDTLNCPAKFVQRSAYEIAFGKRAVNLTPGQREGIRHAFEAEALRAIGCDDAARLFLLLCSGMDREESCVGEMSLLEWCDSLGGVKCKRLLLMEEGEFKNLEHDGIGEWVESCCDDKDDDGDLLGSDSKSDIMANSQNEAPLLSTSNDKTRKQQRRQVTTMSMRQKLEESEALCVSLSGSLDNLATQVSMANQFLLAGGNAFLEYVRKLKATRAQMEVEYEHYRTQWMQNDEELKYLQRCFSNLELSSDSNRVATANEIEDDQDEGTTAALYAASQSKVRKLRACVADMAEENSRCLCEIQRMGRSGTVLFAQKLHEEVDEIKFALAEAKTNEAASRNKLQRFRALVDDFQRRHRRTPSSSTETRDRELQSNESSHNADPPSIEISKGRSTAIVAHQMSSRFKFGTYDFFRDLLLRIFGLGRLTFRKVNPLNDFVLGNNKEQHIII